MVKTRHNPGGEDDIPSDFISLHSRGARRSHMHRQDEYDSDSDEVTIRSQAKVQTGLKSQLADRHMEDGVESRLRPRGPQRQFNYVMDDFSSDEGEDEGRSRRKRSKKVYGHRGSDSSKRNPRSSPLLGRRLTKSAAASCPSAEMEDFGTDEVEERNFRRSTRQRKQTYATLNSSALERATEPMEENIPCSKKKAAGSGSAKEPDFTDMYSRVKRKRPMHHAARDLYGCVSSNSYSGSSPEEDNENDEDYDDESNNNSSPTNKLEECSPGSKSPTKSSYYLRQNKPRTQHFEAPPIEPTRKRPKGLYRERNGYMSPAHRKRSNRRKTVVHGSNTSESSAEESDSERAQQKRTARDLNRCRPVNLSRDEVEAHSDRKDRIRAGASMADIEPMLMDKSITFASVGGMDSKVRQLKETIFLPILYPEVYDKLKIVTPRGVLFHGPPGTGKTLIARALANECSGPDKQVAFFLRKGADVMSKWVGESERSLRLLFDKAYQMRPSIIFFDEIDGLAPVRSTRQDQIHSSIVSTLLALMDGLDSRGEVVVIGATNRIDAIDPALRRPGRFDREFFFPLPDQEARLKILAIHTRDWKPRLKESFLKELAENTVGYCGADLKMLCTEASLCALRNRFPQIYQTSDKLQLDVNSIVVTARHFAEARESIVPTAQRSAAAPSHALCPHVDPLLRRHYKAAMDIVMDTFPHAVAEGQHWAAASEGLSDDENEPSIFELPKRRLQPQNQTSTKFFHFSTHSYIKPSTYRPRLMLAGGSGQGQTTHLGPALLHHLERFPIHMMDLPSLVGEGNRSPEEACVQLLREVTRRLPCILYLPDMDLWWDLVNETVQRTLNSLVSRLKPSDPLLLLATSSMPYRDLPSSLQEMFREDIEVYTIGGTTAEERHEFFGDLLLSQTSQVVNSRPRETRRLEELPRALPQPPRLLSKQERDLLNKKEERILTDLRCFLRDTLNKLSKDRKFSYFMKPVDPEMTPDYYTIVKEPMDMDTMMTKIDLHQYLCVQDFMDDIERIYVNALEYNPDDTTLGSRIRHCAHALRDTATAMLAEDLNEEFEAMCKVVKESRVRRGEARRVSDFAYTVRHPFSSSQPTPSTSSAHMASHSTPMGVRCSRRVRGLEVETMPSLEEVERTGQVERSMQRSQKDTLGSTVSDKTPSLPGGGGASTSTPKVPEFARHGGSSHKLSSVHKCRGEPPLCKRRLRNSSGPLSDKEESDEEDLEDSLGVKRLCVQMGMPVTMSCSSRKVAAMASAAAASIEAAVTSATSNSAFSGTLRGTISASPKLPTFLSRSAASQPQALHDLNNPCNDSGVSSSADSNGDSMDSTDHGNLQKDLESHAEQEQDRDGQGGTLALRSRGQSGASAPEVVVDKPRLERLVSKLVASTTRHSIEVLEKIYCSLSQSLYRHRKHHDKTALITELEEKVNRLCSSK